jgi:hypothetical protein
LLSTSISFTIPLHPLSLMIPWGDANVLSTLVLVRSRMSFHPDVCACTLPQLFCLCLLYSMVSAVNSRCVPLSSDPLTKIHAESLSLMPPLHTELCFVPRTLILPFSTSRHHASALAPAVNFKPSPQPAKHTLATSLA